LKGIIKLIVIIVGGAGFVFFCKFFFYKKKQITDNAPRAAFAFLGKNPAKKLKWCFLGLAKNTPYSLRIQDDFIMKYFFKSKN
jgi:hypothetical protein